MAKTWNKWSPEDIQYLKDHYAEEKLEAITEQLGRPAQAIYTKARYLGLKRTDEFLASKRFQPGNKAGANQYREPRHAPIGNFRYGAGKYLTVRLTVTGNISRDYVLMHHLVWELHYGPIPDKHIVIFKDGNRENTDPANLELKSFEDRMKHNSYLRFPEELREVIILKALITKALKKRKKQSE